MKLKMWKKRLPLCDCLQNSFKVLHTIMGIMKIKLKILALGAVMAVGGVNGVCSVNGVCGESGVCSVSGVWGESGVGSAETLRGEGGAVAAACVAQTAGCNASHGSGGGERPAGDSGEGQVYTR